MRSKEIINLTDEQCRQVDEDTCHDGEWSPRQLADDLAEWPDEFEVRWER